VTRLHDALTGVSAVLVTPFRDGLRDVEDGVLAELAASCDRAGIHVVVALGNTAEVYQLTRDEQRRVLSVVAEARTDASLLAGLTGSAGAQLELAEEAAALGYDAAMVHEPLDPLASPDGIRELWLDLAERSALPLVLYVRTNRLRTADLAELVEHPRVVGIKYAVRGGDVAAALAAAPDQQRCVWICGLAESALPTFAALGVHGFSSGLANVRPDLALGISAAARAADAASLERLVGQILPFEELRNADGGRYNVAVVKAACESYGLAAGEVRPPCVGLDAAAARKLLALLESWPAAPA
jgi:4-hydroxy-tetrahydrodipicolinate synthase